MFTSTPIFPSNFTQKRPSKARWWTAQLWCIRKSTSSMPPSCIKQLWNIVVVPAFTYAVDFLYTGIYTFLHSKTTYSSKVNTDKLTMVQRKAVKHISSILLLVAADTLEVHTHILPTDLLFHKVLFYATACICSLLPSHPLHSIVQHAASRFIKKHKSSTLR